MLEWCHFRGCGKFNCPIRISFVIICFGLHRKNLLVVKKPLFYELNMCFDQTSFDANGDCGGTHSINDIFMKIWKNHIFRERCR
jgi:hypothetical protein